VATTALLTATAARRSLSPLGEIGPLEGG